MLLATYKAASENGALFFPVNPGHENSSWKVFYEEALGRFIAGTYKGELPGQPYQRVQEAAS